MIGARSREPFTEPTMKRILLALPLALRVSGAGQKRDGRHGGCDVSHDRNSLGRQRRAAARGSRFAVKREG